MRKAWNFQSYSMIKHNKTKYSRLRLQEAWDRPEKDIMSQKYEDCYVYNTFHQTDED